MKNEKRKRKKRELNASHKNGNASHKNGLLDIYTIGYLHTWHTIGYLHNWMNLHIWMNFDCITQKWIIYARQESDDVYEDTLGIEDEIITQILFLHLNIAR